MTSSRTHPVFTIYCVVILLRNITQIHGHCRFPLMLTNSECLYEISNNKSTRDEAARYCRFHATRTVVQVARFNMNTKLSSVSPCYVPDTPSTYDFFARLQTAPSVGFENVGGSWKLILSDILKDPKYCGKLNKTLDFVTEQRGLGKVYPAKNNVFAWTRHCSPSDTKVVIIGQDPYPNDNAHGLAFSVQGGQRTWAGRNALDNMCKELADDTGYSLMENYNLTGWSEQGVLLLNAVSTVGDKPRSHAGVREVGWQHTTRAIVKYLSDKYPNKVYILWGTEAQKMKKFITVHGSDERGNLIKKNEVLEAGHPSPLNLKGGFLGCKHFTITNALLKERGIGEIDWNAGSFWK